MLSSILLYIDPGIGSLAAQVILAGFAAFIVFFKNTFRGIFHRKKNAAKPEDQKEVQK